MPSPAVVDPPDTRADTEAFVIGVLLAAGRSDRFGRANKLLAHIDGEPLVRKSARMLSDSKTNVEVVVLGHDSERIGDAVAPLPVETVENPAYGVGQSTSVEVGVEWARERSADAVVVALGDMPLVSPETVNALLSTHATGEWNALAAACDRTRGNPVLFDEAYFDALVDASGDIGGRELLIDNDEAALVETGDPYVLYDIDEPDDIPTDP